MFDHVWNIEEPLAMEVPWRLFVVRLRRWRVLPWKSPFRWKLGTQRPLPQGTGPQGLLGTASDVTMWKSHGKTIGKWSTNGVLMCFIPMELWMCIGGYPKSLGGEVWTWLIVLNTYCFHWIFSRDCRKTSGKEGMRGWLIHHSKAIDRIITVHWVLTRWAVGLGIYLSLTQEIQEWHILILSHIIWHILQNIIDILYTIHCPGISAESPLFFQKMISRYLKGETPRAFLKPRFLRRRSCTLHICSTFVFQVAGPSKAPRSRWKTWKTWG